MSDLVSFDDLRFVKYLSKEKIATRVREVAIDIIKDHSSENPIFLVILNGAFMFAADLLRHFDFPYEVVFVEAKSYQGMASTGNVVFDKGKLIRLQGRSVIIIEDIIDSGNTLHDFIDYLSTIGLDHLDIATLLSKPEARKHVIDCKYIGFEIADLFVVGYGLDYNDMGRGLPHIYQLLPQTVQ